MHGCCRHVCALDAQLCTQWVYAWVRVHLFALCTNALTGCVTVCLAPHQMLTQLVYACVYLCVIIACTDGLKDLRPACMHGRNHHVTWRHTWYSEMVASGHAACMQPYAAAQVLSPTKKPSSGHLVIDRNHAHAITSCRLPSGSSHLGHLKHPWRTHPLQHPYLT